MNSENTVLLVKQLEKINSSRSKNNLAGAWITLLLSIAFFTSLFYKSFFPIPANAVVWAWVLLFLFAIVLMLQSLFIIFSDIVNKRFAIIIQSILDLEKK
jgi:cobalamin biosynthesis protein CobD/CbiB